MEQYESKIRNTFKNKQSGKVFRVFCHFSHSFNDEGKIIRQVAYYDGSLFEQN